VHRAQKLLSLHTNKSEQLMTLSALLDRLYTL